MSKNILFYTLAFGNKAYYLQSQLLMISLLHFRPSNSVLRIYTDDPDFFRFLRNDVEIRTITREYLQSCIDEHKGYVYSSKLNMIKTVTEDTRFAATVFLDTDIVAHQPLQSFVDTLAQNSFFMYRKERSYSRESTKEYWDALNRINLHGYRLDRQSSQWNSGVVALQGDNRERLAHAASIMDQLYEAKVQQHTLEQVAISVVLEDTGSLKAAQDWFIHYHANKSGWEPLSNELEAMKNQNGSLSEMKEWFGGISAYPSEYGPKPDVFTKVIGKWKNSIKKRLPHFG